MASEQTYKNMHSAYCFVKTELEKESDRGCVVLAFAWMDEQFTAMLKKFFLPSKHEAAKADELLGVGRPIGDAATKIDLLLRLGLISPSTHKSLHLFRKLRNDFAHLSSSLAFTTDHVRDRVVAIFDNEETLLNGLWVGLIQDEEIRKATETHRGKSGARILRDALGTRKLFIATAAVLVSELILLHDTLIPIKYPMLNIGLSESGLELVSTKTK